MKTSSSSLGCFVLQYFYRNFAAIFSRFKAQIPETYMPKLQTKNPSQFHAMNSDKINCKTNGQIAGFGKRKNSKKTDKKNKAQERENKWKWNELEHCFGVIPDEDFFEIRTGNAVKKKSLESLRCGVEPAPVKSSSGFGGKFEDFIKIFCKWFLNENFSPYFLVGAELENFLKGAKIKEILELKDGWKSALVARNSATFPSFLFSSLRSLDWPSALKLSLRFPNLAQSVRKPSCFSFLQPSSRQTPEALFFVPDFSSQLSLKT